jgi:4-hydroxy-2-oxoheptanedioate aldolase
MKPVLRKNPLKQKIMNGETAFGLYICVPSPALVELAGYAGYDFVRIDISHSPLDTSLLENMVRAAEVSGITATARVEFNPIQIAALLEMGFQGLVVPGVESVETAQEIVRAARFHPMGDRGIFSATRVGKYGYISGKDYLEWSNEEVLLGVQIESKEAVDKMDEILSVKGIDMIMSGRHDLAKSFGLTGQASHPTVLEAEQKIYSAALRHGKSICVHMDPLATNLADNITQWKNKGAQVFTLGHDATLIRKAFEKPIEIARQVGTAPAAEAATTKR